MFMKITKIRSLFSKSFIILLNFSFLFSCNKVSSIEVENVLVEEDSKFHSANLKLSIDDFNSKGFKLGDSCNVKFSNGYELEDVPYFNGYYVKNEKPVIVAYPSSDFVVVTLNNYGIWDEAKLKEGDTVSIYLNESQKYISIQEALSQSYSLDRSSYDSDDEFSNFRELSFVNIRNNLIYRGASPLDNSRNRAKITDDLLKKNNIKSVIDLADSQEDVEKYLSEDNFESYYTKSLYLEGNVELLSMSSSYNSIEYKKSVVKGFKHILNTEGPYYIHCMEGKDRTGFVSMLLEALLDSSYEDMCNDYMLTYKNYFKITKENDLNKYNAIKELYFDSFMESLYGSDELNVLINASYQKSAINYLLEGGMSEQEIENLINKIGKIS